MRTRITIPSQLAAGTLAVLALTGTALAQSTPTPQTTTTITVDVVAEREQIADQQIKEQEQQRLLGIFPNFRVSYRQDAVPLNARQKFQLAWKSVADPTRFASIAIVSGVQYARNDFSGFGRGFEGYGKRYAALYGTSLTATMMSNAILPSILRQDPRYFYQGTGTAKSRVGYALSRAVLRKGDNGRWQPDYSRIVGGLASGALSNLYYPKDDRRSARLMLGNAAFAIAGAAAGNLFQEFLFKRLTTHSNHASQAK
jgi:hypothetical protein